MLGTELNQYGQLLKTDALMLVHISLAQGESVPAHDHKGQDVFFTPVAGKMLVTLDGKEEHTLTSGSVLRFAGENTISVKALEDSEFFVYLITPRG